MPLESKSLLKIYRCNRFLGESYPIIVTTGDTVQSDIPFEEYFIFHSIPDIPFLFRRVRSTAAEDMRPFDFGQFPEVFAAEALLEAALRSARERLEFEVSRQDRELHREIFWSARPVVYDETDDLPLVEFRVFKQFVSERTVMCEFTRSKAVRQLCRKLSTLPEFDRTAEPTD